MMCFIVGAAISIGIACVVIRLNLLIKKTNCYCNEYRYVEEINRNIGNMFEIVNLGSTYSQFACQALDDYIYSSKNFGMHSQQLIYDYKLLRQKSAYLREDAVILLFINPIVLSLENTFFDGTGYHNLILPFNLVERQDKSIKKIIKYKFPIIIARKYLKAIIRDGERKDINDLYSIPLGKDNEHSMKICAERWAAQLHIDNLIETKDDINLAQALEKNIQTIKLIMEYCHEKKFQLIFVAAPFSKLLNQYISVSFENKYMVNPIKENFPEVPFINFMRNDEFQNTVDLYNDGGFLLNRSGSLRFLKILFEEIDKMKVENPSGSEKLNEKFY